MLRRCTIRCKAAPGGGGKGPGCVLVLYGSNDLRVHDHYPLALAVKRASELNVPVVAAYCFDERCFAQPSLIGGFYRASPQRAGFLTACVEDLRSTLRKFKSELYVRTGRPEAEVPRLAQELGAVEVFASTQYAPHEETVQRAISEALEPLLPQPATDGQGDAPSRRRTGLQTLWNSTLYHLDDLTTPPEAMREHFRHFLDEVDLVQVRTTDPFNCDDGRIAQLGNSRGALEAARPGVAAGRLPTLEELGYQNLGAYRNIQGTVGNWAFVPGESGAFARLEEWLKPENLAVYHLPLNYRDRRVIVDDERMARLSPYISTGCLSPRTLYEALAVLDSEHAASELTTQQTRVALARLAKRDYMHFLGLKWGRRLFFPYGPHPEDTDAIPDQRLDRGIIQRWCAGLTGFPFVDAGMRELTVTGWAAQPVRETMVWMLTRGFGQDWRVAAEWLERCSLDYDPFVCYGWTAYYSELIVDRFGDPVRKGLYNATRADSTGIYTKHWLPQLARIPMAYVHRPHVISEKMQRMYQVTLGVNYPWPVKLWRGAQREFDELPSYFQGVSRVLEPGMYEAARFNPACLSKAEAHPCVTAEAINAIEASVPPDNAAELVPAYAARRQQRQHRAAEPLLRLESSERSGPATAAAD